jgi:heterodisulfide reductase subunit A-like polyferredoxin
VKHLKAWPAPAFHPEGEADPPDLPDFSETISADIESTRRDLRAFNLSEGGSRAERQLEALRQKLLDQALEEIAEMRGQVALLTTTMKTKASKAKFELLSKALTEKTDKRLDNIRNLVLAAVAIIGGLVTWIKAKG